MKFLCWLLGHKWREISRRHTKDLDDVEYKCARCGDEAGGSVGMLRLPKRRSQK
ncbi:MAG: DUF1660 family phage protein [Giesbergeria sp.]